MTFISGWYSAPILKFVRRAWEICGETTNPASAGLRSSDSLQPGLSHCSPSGLVRLAGRAILRVGGEHTLGLAPFRGAFRFGRFSGGRSRGKARATHRLPSVNPAGLVFENESGTHLCRMDRKNLMQPRNGCRCLLLGVNGGEEGPRRITATPRPPRGHPEAYW